MSAPAIVSLFSGYGGLDLGVQMVIGGEVIAHCEIEPAPSQILAHHWPDVPNLGDITKVDWAALRDGLTAEQRRYLVMTMGFPCQDVSLAGKRRGLKDGTRSGLWAEAAAGIEALKPRLVVIENVRGLLSAEATGPLESDPWGMGNGADGPALRAIGAVLGDLSDLGYDAEWTGVRAADAGAPHGRYRVFIVAENANIATGDQRRKPTPGQAQSGRTRANTRRRSGTPTTNPGGDEPERWGIVRNMGGAEVGDESARREERQRIRHATGGSRATAPDTDNPGRGEQRRTIAVRPELATAEHVGDEPVTDADGDGLKLVGRVNASQRDADRRDSAHPAWGSYEPAIRRWEQHLGRTAPPPTNPDGKNGANRLSSRFVEWMMGLPEGHVTDVGLTRNQELKALGNGVVPQQAALALRALLSGERAA